MSFAVSVCSFFGVTLDRYKQRLQTCFIHMGSGYSFQSFASLLFSKGFPLHSRAEVEQTES